MKIQHIIIGIILIVLILYLFKKKSENFAPDIKTKSSELLSNSKKIYEMSKSQLDALTEQNKQNFPLLNSQYTYVNSNLSQIDPIKNNINTIYY